jgi:hypothetical protein
MSAMPWSLLEDVAHHEVRDHAERMTDGEPIVLRKTSAVRDAPTKGVPGQLIRYQVESHGR